MEKQKMRELIDFAKDETRVNAAFENVIDGIESGRIRADEFQLAAGPLRVGALKEDREYVARLLEKAASTPLDDNQRHILYATVAELPEDAGLYDVIDALNEAGSLSTFVGALRKFLDDAARPRGDTSAL
uniref:Uncharacterized protein n=1 Tax=Pseudomonas fluorescens (strain SBW25) TaxID=216595 RepID=A0A0G4E4U2_PSEFS|nr:hypothetical protein [Pseudomonas fluorescens]CEK42261.1 hypothetical protein PQBR57_0308 [Pseudomonas fluorescens SBW25]